MGTVKYKKGETEFEMPVETFKEYIKPAHFRKLIEDKRPKWSSRWWKWLNQILPFLPKIIAVFK